MNENSTQTETLIQYMDGTLSEQERTAVAQSILNNSEMAEEFDRLQTARSAVRRLGLQQHIASVHAEMMPQFKTSSPAKVFSMSRFVMRVAAAVVFLVIGTAAFQYFTVSTDSLYNEKYAAFTVPVTRDGASSEKIVEAYRAANYTEVLKQFQLIAQPETRDQFYAGMASLELKFYPGAVQFFKNTIESNRVSGTPIFQEDAEYYLALSYLKTNEIPKALPIFQKIYDTPQHLYHDKVSTLYLLQLKMASWK